MDASVACVIASLLCLVGLHAADEPLKALPEGDTGIAAKFPNDAGIDKAPGVVFTDDYENGKTNADNSWGDLAYPEDAAKAHGGKRCMQCTIVRPGEKKEIGLGMTQHFNDGYDELHLRYYAKFDKDTELFHGGTHNGGCIMARAPGVPDAKPGIPADGKNEYTALLDTWRSDPKVASPGNIAVYCYHPEQRHQWGEHFFPSGKMMPYGLKPGEYFGKGFQPRPEFIPERGRWYCYELMVKANTPGKRDGRIAIWIDGKLMADFINLRLRDVDSLKANRISLGLYTQNDLVNKNVTMWYDDVVVATSYIGPKKEKK